VRVDDLDEALGRLIVQLGDRGREVRELVDAGIDLETDRCLGPAAGPDRLLGLGPFLADDRAELAGCRGADEVAAALDRWLGDRAVSLDGFWDRLAALAGSRRVIVYGLGANGRALARLAPAADHGVTGRLCGHDDAVVERPATLRPAPRTWSPRDCLVLVTPNERGAIAARLARLGFVEGRDWLTIRQVAAAGTPSGCTSARSAPGCDR
jgi:hypothetical protein